jgi:hypothetical protein
MATQCSSARAEVAERTLFGIALLAFVSLGLPDGVLGVAWPSMRPSFELPMSQLGVVLTAASVPVGVLVLWSGVGPASGAAGLAFLGPALAPIYPLLIAATPERVGSSVPRMRSGFQVAAFYLGAATLPGGAGLLARHAGLDGLGLFLLAAALGLGGLHGLGYGWRRARGRLGAGVTLES